MITILTVISLGRVPELAQESQQTGNLAASSQELNEGSDPQLTGKELVSMTVQDLGR